MSDNFNNNFNSNYSNNSNNNFINNRRNGHRNRNFQGSITSTDYSLPDNFAQQNIQFPKAPSFGQFTPSNSGITRDWSGSEMQVPEFKGLNAVGKGLQGKYNADASARRANKNPMKVTIVEGEGDNPARTPDTTLTEFNEPKEDGFLKRKAKQGVAKVLQKGLDRFSKGAGQSSEFDDMGLDDPLNPSWATDDTPAPSPQPKPGRKKKDDVPPFPSFDDDPFA